jgi:uncharacterized protein
MVSMVIMVKSSVAKTGAAIDVASYPKQAGAHRANSTPGRGDILPAMRLLLRLVCVLGLPCVCTAVFAADPPPDCKATKVRSLERLMCRSPMLSRLDVELTRVYTLATAPKAGAAVSAIRQQQTAWITQRAACARSATQETCVRDLYLARIAAIRAQSRPARSADDKGISLGPFAFRCEKLDDILHITYVNVDPGQAWVTLKDQSYPLVQQRSGSGARYEGNGTLFWEHQGEARWRGTTSAPETSCTRATTG